MKTFNKWLESQTWHDYHSSKGNFKPGYNPIKNNMPLPPVSKNKDLNSLLTYGGGDPVFNMKMVHDMMLDSVEITPDELEIFIHYFMQNMPEPSEELCSDWRIVIQQMSGKISPFTINLLHRVMVDTSKNSLPNTPNGKYIKVIFPLIRSLIKQLSSKDYKDAASRRRFGESNWHDYHSSKGNFKPGYNPIKNNMPLPSISDDEEFKDRMYSSRGINTTPQDVKYHIHLMHDRILDSPKVKLEDVEMFFNLILGHIPKGGETVRFAWDWVLNRFGYNKIDLAISSHFQNAMKVTSQAAKQNNDVGRYLAEYFPLMQTVLERLKDHKEYQSVLSANRLHRKMVNVPLNI